MVGVSFIIKWAKMKPQKYPASKMKVGLVLYRVTVFTDDEDGKTTIDVEQWVVRSIKKNEVRRRGAVSHYRQPFIVKSVMCI